MTFDHSMILEQWLHCTDCAAEQVFAALECLDGHGQECPERACTVCGAAVVLGVWIDRSGPRPVVLRDVA